MNKPDYDLCIIGGGINGAGIARDAAGRGLKVLLVEKGDLAGATSSASSKMLHGGLRYLEYFEFKLVQEALAEREILLNLAPHIIRPMDFVLPQAPGLRPGWMIRIGLFLYDHLAGRRKLGKSHGIDLAREAYGAPLQPQYTKGFVYADGWLDDARLVVLNVMDAAQRGAKILTRTVCTGLTVRDGAWTVTLKDAGTGAPSTITAAKIVNAAGPWVRANLDAWALATDKTPGLRLVKGSHIVVPRIYGGEQAYLLQQPDKRVVFAWPYGPDFNYIGTTDVDFHGDPATVTIDAAEIEYLCAAVNRFFKKPVAPADVTASWSGVRPLLDDGHDSAASVTRDYKLVEDDSHGAPLLSIFGGKITTYRHLSEEVVDKLYGGKSWTAAALLPGGDIPDADFEAFLMKQEERYIWLPRAVVERYAHQFGTRMDRLLEGRDALTDMGAHFGDGLYEAEVRYLIDHEWARTAEDILWRRTKLKLRAAPETVRSLEDFFKR